MSNTVVNQIVEELVGMIEIPESSYATAEKRYKDLAEWFKRPESRCSGYSPHIYPQGSFRLGTVVRPITPEGEYDLDVGCRLRGGITKSSHSQKQLKLLVGADLLDYRTARGITQKLEAMHRCWRLRYADKLSFHMDTVPSIPETIEGRQLIREAMVRVGVGSDLAGRVSEFTGAITDDRMPNYEVISSNWRISNSEGYALWFESRMKLASGLLLERAIKANRTRVDDLPAYQWKSPLQTCVQLLKRHRDAMFASNPDGAPISIIITTLAGRAYQGESDIAAALDGILQAMHQYINPVAPRVANPVNPAEDFADKWADPSCRRLTLEANFGRWLAQARTDFASLKNGREINTVVETARKQFAATLDPKALRARLGSESMGGLLSAAAVPSGLSFPPKPVVPSKPAGFA